jgi:hypothetical protein
MDRIARIRGTLSRGSFGVHRRQDGAPRRTLADRRGLTEKGRVTLPSLAFTGSRYAS